MNNQDWQENTGVEPVVFEQIEIGLADGSRLVGFADGFSWSLLGRYDDIIKWRLHESKE